MTYKLPQKYVYLGNDNNNESCFPNISEQDTFIGPNPRQASALKVIAEI